MTLETHEAAVERALSAIKDVFSDRSVSRRTIQSSLQELRDEIDIMLDSLPLGAFDGTTDEAVSDM